MPIRVDNLFDLSYLNSQYIRLDGTSTTTAPIPFAQGMEVGESISPLSDSDSDFTIIWMTDTHNTGTGTSETEWDAMIAWIIAQKSTLNIQAVIHTGDVRDQTKAFTTSVEGFNALKAQSIKTIMTIGNHDYDNTADIGDRSGTTEWNAAFGESYFSGETYYGDAYGGTDTANYYCRFTVGSHNYLVLALEYFPRDAVLTWAQGLIDTYTTDEVIIATHALVNAEGSYIETDDSQGPIGQGNLTDYNNGQEMWDEFLKLNDDQIICVLTGHNHDGTDISTSRRMDAGTSGYGVHQLFHNYQASAGTSGYVAIMKFQPSSGKINVSFYSTVLSSYDANNPAYDIAYVPTRWNQDLPVYGNISSTGSIISESYIIANNGVRLQSPYALVQLSVSANRNFVDLYKYTDGTGCLDSPEGEDLFLNYLHGSVVRIGNGYGATGETVAFFEVTDTGGTYQDLVLVQLTDSSASPTITNYDDIVGIDIPTLGNAWENNFGIRIHECAGGSVENHLIVLESDTTGISFGVGHDARIYYDGTNFVIDPKAVGTGYLSVLGDINTGSSITGLDYYVSNGGSVVFNSDGEVSPTWTISNAGNLSISASGGSTVEPGVAVGALYVTNEYATGFKCTKTGELPSVFTVDLLNKRVGILGTPSYAFDVTGVARITSTLRLDADSDQIIFDADSAVTTTLTDSAATSSKTITLPNFTGTLYISGGTDVTVADGGTGRSSHTAYALIAGGTTTTAAQQSIANSATSGVLLQGKGTSAVAGWTTATYPATATATGTILRADGTNWVATTATYPTTTTDNQILYSTSANVIGGSALLTFDDTSLQLGNGTTLSPLLLRGIGATTARRGGSIVWYGDATTTPIGYTFCNPTSFVWDSSAQSTALDTGVARINFSTGDFSCGIVTCTNLAYGTKAGDSDYATSYDFCIQSTNSETWLEILNNTGTGKGAFFGVSGNDFLLYNYQQVATGKTTFFGGASGSENWLSLSGAGYETVFNDGALDINFRIETLGASGNTFLIDGGTGITQIGTPATNYTQFDSTGHQTMAGTAKPWEDLRIEPVARTTGTGAPAFEKWYDDVAGTSVGVFLYSFTDESVAGNEKQVFFSMQMPHAWDSGSISIHVHWVGNNADTTAAPRWGLEYAWKDLGEVYGDSTIVYSDGSNYTATGTDADITANKHYISKFAAIAPGSTADGISSILIGRLFRNSSDAGDTYDVGSNKCGLLYIDAHYQISSIGSTDEYSK